MVVYVVARYGCDETTILGTFTSRALAALAIMREIYAEQIAEIMEGDKGNVITNIRDYGHAVEISTDYYGLLRDEYYHVLFTIERTTVNDFS